MAEPELPIWEHQRREANRKAARQIGDALAAEAEEMEPDPKPNRKRYRRAAEWHPPKPGSPPREPPG